MTVSASTSRPTRIERFALLDEAVLSLSERKVRTLLTGLGTVLGVGVLLSVLGLTATATSQIDSRFTALSATEVTITQVNDPIATRAMAFPDDFEDRIRRLHGVKEVGLVWSLAPEIVPVRPATVPVTRAAPAQAIDVMAVSPGAFTVAGAQARMGRIYDGFAQRTQAKVAVIGPSVASDLGIASLAGRPALSLGGVRFTVVGILGTVERHAELLNSVVIPSDTARGIWGDPGGGLPAAGWVEVSRGAGQVVAHELAIATSASYPERFEVIPPPDPRQLRGSINSDLQSLFVVLAIVCLIVGMVGIANTTFVTVMERLGEIGLRRALGARRRHIALQFLAEAAVIGLIGGLVGAVLGLSVVILVALAKGWTAVVPPALILAGPAIGAVTAVLAAAYPAYRGATTEPVTALRAGA